MLQCCNACRLHVEVIPAIAWFPEVMALSIMNTRKINRNGATTNRIIVELLFRNATLATEHKSLSGSVCMCGLLLAAKVVNLVYGTVGSKAA